MAKKALKERETKRQLLVTKFAEQHQTLKKASKNNKLTLEERDAARIALQKLPRNANPVRLRTRCTITGRPRGTFRQFGLGRIKIREMAMVGEIPGVIKASW
jgi:small subunit ribosomal protein S14